MLKKYLHELQEQDILAIGKHNHVPDKDFDPNELQMGIEIESSEHTHNMEIAKAMVKDHLSEISDYYTRLKRMEEKAKKE